MYAKLIFRNAKRSAKDYLIYIVTLTICVTLFYAFLSISSSYYQPDIGTAYEITAFSDGIKLAVCAITLLLLFLIRYVNSYMLRRKQKEFAVQSIMGMEQKTIGWLFFAETFLMGAISIALGIALGVLCSQFMSAMLLASYGHSYELTWTLFPDTVLWTVGFFTISFFVVGLFNVRTIRKIKIIDMLSADRQNEPDLKKNRFIPTILVIYLVLSIWMLETGIQKMIFFFDPRFAFPLHILFWGNIIFPALTLLWSFVWLLKKKVWTLQTLLIGLLACTVPNTVLAALVPVFESKYYLKTAMIYGAVVLMVMCLTILSLQQLLDAGKYKYRFGVLRKLGTEESDIKKLMRKQLRVWFGLPITVAVIVSFVVVAYFIQSVSNEIASYIGFDKLLLQVGITVAVLILLLVCYYISTWILFSKSTSNSD